MPHIASPLAGEDGEGKPRARALAAPALRLSPPGTSGGNSLSVRARRVALITVERVAPAARARTAGSDWIAAAGGGKNGGTDMLAKVEAPRSAAELRARYRGARDRLMGSAGLPAPPA